jgi:hypothetical protein
LSLYCTCASIASIVAKGISKQEEKAREHRERCHEQQQSCKANAVQSSSAVG